MGRQNSFVHVGHIVNQEFNFFAKLVWHTVTGCIWDIDHSSASFDNSFNHTSQVFVFSTSGIFGIEFYIFDIAFGIFHCGNGTLNNFVLIRVQFVMNVVKRSSDTSVNAAFFGEFEGFGSNINVFFDCAGKGTNGWPGNRF